AGSVVLYQQNWWSIENTVDYYVADSSAASPLRHFWSLSVQGQVYLLWPLIFLVCALLIRALGGSGRRTVLITVFSLIFIVSLNYSVRITEAHQVTAYFNTWARLWEFALGSLLALTLPVLKLPRLVRAVMGWAGIAAIISCGFVLDVNGSFPGYVALWPTLAAALIIAAGDTGTRFGPEKLLTARPLLALGGFSYALYLLHWPLLVFYLSFTKQEKAGVWAGLGLLLLAMVLAWLLTRLVETPLRTWALPNRSSIAGFATVLVCIGVGLAPSYAWDASIHRQAADAEANRANNNVGAAALDSNFEYTGAENPTVIPIRAVMDSDWADLGESCADLAPDMPVPDEIAGTCTIPVQTDNPTQRVIVAGNSHMQMWLTALRPLAQQEGWELVSITQPGCFLTEEDNAAFASGPNCDAWAAATWSFIKEQAPDALFVNGTRSLPNEPDVLLTGLEPHIAQLTAAGTRVIGVRDTPRMEEMHKDCLDAFGSVEECTKPAGMDVYHDPQRSIEQTNQGFAAVNLSDLICPENACPPSIGNVYTYFDYDHITATYIETLGDLFNSRVLDAMNRADAAGQAHRVQPAGEG
ncbi:MAG: acyltransferase family protein, partial [Rothia sp. (in: high G+C Gram-positive bacteria)]|nr:acyltransferase family protein [Rothia sp. (in: high G+C Gram-positive bacteria)]